ncbi:MAG: TrmH family RNA methyltransferase, partial [Flammeovirgaceae bacterium]
FCFLKKIMDDQQVLLARHFEQYLTEKRKSVIQRVLSQRTRHIVLVLENILQPHNMSAVVRTCECYGVQNLHIIDDQNHFEVNKRILKGSNKWIDIVRYKEKNINNTAPCLHDLKHAGYQILVTHPDVEGISIEEVDVTQKIALVMGNESKGVSNEALQLADQKVYIPMVGFTESMNISVSAAICLHTLLPKLRRSQALWQLSEYEQDFLRLQWMKKSIRRSDLIEQEFLKSII